MRVDRQFATSALAFLFFAEGQRAYFASLFGLAYDALFPELRPGAALLTLLPLAGLFAPLLPIARRFDRAGAVALAAVGLAVFRLPMTFPDFLLRATSATLVVASGALFLTWAVGHFEGRAVAGGAIAGLVADQLLRLAGTSWDLSLRPGWLPVQAILSLALLFLVLAPEGRLRGPARATETAGDGSPLERRAGGMRLRGALALGALLFLDLHLLGLPPVVSRWTGVSYELAAISVSAAGAIALAVALADGRTVRSRSLALGLVLLLAAGLPLGPWLGGPVGAGLLAAGHGAALLLLARALYPASGRRAKAVAIAGMLTFTGLTVLYAATFFYPFLFPFLRGGMPWILGATVVLIGAAFLLLPQAPASPRRLSGPAAVGAGSGVLVLAAVLVLVVQAPAPRPSGSSFAGGEQDAGDAGAPLRVATYNIHFGFDEGWRFDPAAIAEVIRSTDPDVVALQEVPVGMPIAYGIDYPLWLERRLGMRGFFFASLNRLKGDAILTRTPARGVRAIPLPSGHGDPKHLLHLDAIVDGRTVDIYAVHLNVQAAERAEQIAAALEHIGRGPAVFLGDLNAESNGSVAAALRTAGFLDAFEVAGVQPSATWPAARPELRIDWVWVRGLGADGARVVDALPSDHRLVAATLQVQPPNH